MGHGPVGGDISNERSSKWDRKSSILPLLIEWNKTTIKTLKGLSSTYKLCQGESPLLEFRHLNWKEDYFSALGPGYWKPFGMSLILRLQDGANPEVDLQSSFQTRLAQLLWIKSLSSYTHKHISKENGHKAEATEDAQMKDLSYHQSISSGTLGDEFKSLLNMMVMRPCSMAIQDFL